MSKTGGSANAGTYYVDCMACISNVGVHNPTPDTQECACNCHYFGELRHEPHCNKCKPQPKPECVDRKINDNILQCNKEEGCRCLHCIPQPTQECEEPWCCHNPKCSLVKCKPTQENDWEEYVKKWEEQGRSEVQIWAVRNFMTGQGAIMMQNFISKAELKERVEKDKQPLTGDHGVLQGYVVKVDDILTWLEGE